MGNDEEDTTPQPRSANDLVYPVDSPTLPIIHLQGINLVALLKKSEIRLKER